jgi:polysaccharide biosynthesis protein PelF
MNRISVLLTTEGTYPFHKGGVSTWCHVLTQKLPEIDFKILAIAANPYLSCQYDLAPNILQLIKIPLWGTDDPVEYSWRFPCSRALKSKFATTEKTIARYFLPVFEQFLHGVLYNSIEMNNLGDLLLNLHRYFLRYDYHQTMISQTVWRIFQRLLLGNWQKSDRDPSMAEITEAIRLFYRLFIPIHVPVPVTDLTHSSAAAFCGLSCVLAKLDRGTPYLLTEHGVNIREQYLNLHRSIDSPFVCQFLYCLMGTVVKLNFYYADIISPVCEYNSRWEKWWGVPQEKIKVIYNGADPEVFKPTPPVAKERPIILNVGLIFPLKGQLDLIKAAAIVRKKFPDVEFRFYGKASDLAYFEECQQLVKKFQLESIVNFAGFTSEPWRAYSEADIVVMSSISEGFPFAVVEAMLSAGTIVATDVGGVREAIADTGLMVRAKRPDEMAEAIIKLLSMSATERREYGKKALARALALFTQKTFLDEHLKIYYNLLDREGNKKRETEEKRQLVDIS